MDKNIELFEMVESDEGASNLTQDIEGNLLLSGSVQPSSGSIPPL